MANIQVRVNDELKSKADVLFTSLGLDTSTAIHITLTTAIKNNGLPFEVKHRGASEALMQAVSDSRV